MSDLALHAFVRCQVTLRAMRQGDCRRRARRAHDGARPWRRAPGRGSAGSGPARTCSSTPACSCSSRSSSAAVHHPGPAERRDRVEAVAGPV
jgi:hypothetical protein